jgi:hypothetical protein
MGLGGSEISGIAGSHIVADKAKALLEATLKHGFAQGA